MKELQENSIFIADSHYPHHGEEFLNILEKIDKQELNPPQLFLMGDNFDLLFGHNDYIQKFSKEAIELLQKLSLKLAIIYLEGNHDFCLKEVFPNIQIYTRDEQPIHYQFNGKDVYLSHGDKYETGFGYNLYSKILRNKITLTLLKPFQKAIINDRIKKLKAKKICSKFKGYQKRFDAIRSHYPKESLIIEGHFHQSVIHKNYVSLPSLACQKKVGVIQNGEVIFIEI